MPETKQQRWERSQREAGLVPVRVTKWSHPDDEEETRKAMHRAADRVRRKRERERSSSTR